jgi:hypothetical protein
MPDPNDSAACAASLASVQAGPWLWRSDDAVYSTVVNRSRISPDGELQVYLTGEGWLSYADFAANRALLTDVLAGAEIPG